PSLSPVFTRRSTFAASSSASSARSATTAFSEGFILSIRSIDTCTSSTAEICFSRTEVAKSDSMASVLQEVVPELEVLVGLRIGHPLRASYRNVGLGQKVTKRTGKNRVAFQLFEGLIERRRIALDSISPTVLVGHGRGVHLNRRRRLKLALD